MSRAGPEPAKPTMSPSTSAANILKSGPCTAQWVHSSAMRRGEIFSSAALLIRWS